MNRQPPRRSVFHMLLSILTRKAPQQTKQPIQPPQHPAPGDRDAWHAHWKAQGQSWRTEPEIDLQRQAELAQTRAIVPDIERGIYPFKGVKLSRADVEWLLAIHDNRRGPVDWNDTHQRERQGLDLRGADLSNEDLRGLPLAKLLAGLVFYGKWSFETAEQRNIAGTHLEGADLHEAHLEGANLRGAHLERTNLFRAYLERADLSRANLKEANVREVQLPEASLVRAHLEGADLRRSHLEGSDLRETHFEGTDLREAHLEDANLRRAFFTSASNLDGIILGNTKHENVQLAGTHFGDADLTMVNWSQIKMLGDECRARQPGQSDEKGKDAITRLHEYQKAVQANRQLAVVLQAQGLNEQAARFAYRAQVLQRRVFWFEVTQQNVKLRQRGRSLGAWLFSWFLFLLAGYGYKPERSFLAYLLVISTFMILYLHLNPHLAWYEAIVVSMTAFHGRGFSPSTFSPGDPLSIVSAVEAFVGLIIEVTFIATLTRRFFGQ